VAARIIQAFVAEVQRRRVLRTVAVYAVGAWLILQVAELTLEHLGFPYWAMRALIIAVIVGFPLVFLLAWSLQSGPRGFRFDLPLWRGLDPDRPRPQTKSDLVVLAALVLLLGTGIYGGIRLFYEEIPGPDQEAIVQDVPDQSIAVMMFENFSSGAESDYFGGGLAEEILNLLAGIRDLNVAARTSSFQFRGEAIDIRDVAEILRVKYVLEGSVRHEAGRIRVTAQLIDGRNNYHVWSDVYERKLKDIFAIQEEIASAVVNELKIVLSIDTEDQLQRKPTDSIDAYIYYIQGRGRLRDSYDNDGMAAATQLFEQALETDPTFARAYGGICEAQLRRYASLKATSYFDAAAAACDEALKLDPALDTEVSISMGELYRHRGWFEKAEETLTRAIVNSPSSVQAIIALGEVFRADGRRDEAEATFLRAVDLKRQDWRAYDALSAFYYETERYQESAAAAEIGVSLRPDSARAASSLGSSYWMLGDYERASAAFRRSLELKPTRMGYTNMGTRLYYIGDFQGSEEMQLAALEFAPDDHRIWGRLAETYRFMPGRDGDAFDAYVRAADLAEKNLAVNDLDWNTTGLLAIYYAHTDRRLKALAAGERAVELSNGDSEALYYQALAVLRTGDADAALDALEKAVASDDQYRQFIETDPDLKTLSASPRYQALLPAALNPVE